MLESYQNIETRGIIVWNIQGHTQQIQFSITTMIDVKGRLSAYYLFFTWSALSPAQISWINKMWKQPIVVENDAMQIKFCPVLAAMFAEHTSIRFVAISEKEKTSWYRKLLLFHSNNNWQIYSNSSTNLNQRNVNYHTSFDSYNSLIFGLPCRSFSLYMQKSQQK